MSSEVTWQTPPPANVGRRQKYDWDKIAAELRSAPGQWAFLGNHTNSNGQRIRHGYIPAFRPAGSFEATLRNVANNHGDLYARYRIEVTA